MKKTKLKILLTVIEDVLIFIMGAALALIIQSREIDGTAFILPLSILLIFLGWIWRGAVEDIKK
ncbi:MAG: hypothetical protein NC120_13855 [Ruminococcus sp.]|nr:hypothetical protein [Ruminococcus sp.]MCM1525528.1 hypothetical protein [Ruminococcus sp.]